MIINLTQHQATPDQIEAGVVDVNDRDLLSKLLTVPISGELGIVSNPHSAPEFLDSKARTIFNNFVLPILMKKAQSFLNEGGYVCSKLEAYQILDKAIIAENVQAMVGGAPYLVEHLVNVLYKHGVTPVYALSDRESVETVQADGSVVKTQKFMHKGFIPAIATN